jgi:methylated-DNA-[protein]-cysteine S-methyltransferase
MEAWEAGSMNIYYCETEIGRVGIAEEGGRVTHVCLRPESAPQEAEIRETDTIKEACRQLKAYLAGELTEFSLPLAPRGTDFQRSVWSKLLEVPYGRTASYKDIARAVGNPKAARAVGMANNRNPIAVFIPCHRVIGSDGGLVGYGAGLELKRKLLDLERSVLAER